MGCVDTAPHLGGQPCHFFNVNRHFRANMQNIQKYQNYHSDFNHFLHSDKDHQVLFLGYSKMCITNSRWQADAI